ncbi:hypothetical protein QQ045_032556 [Rhodiola kirilowii]
MNAEVIHMGELPLGKLMGSNIRLYQKQQNNNLLAGSLKQSKRLVVQCPIGTGLGWSRDEVMQKRYEISSHCGGSHTKLHTQDKDDAHIA